MNLEIKPKHSKQRSLRRQLLLWVFVPMLVLITVDTTILYRIALNIIEKSYDRSLADTAQDIFELLKVSKIAPDQFEMDNESRKVILSDQYDETYFAIFDHEGRFLAGDTGISFIPYTRKYKGVQKEYFTDTNIMNKNVRTLVLDAHFVYFSGKQDIYIQVAETLNKRNRLAQRILLGLLIPQLLLAVTAVIVLSYAIQRGLAPLNHLNDAIAKRSHRELSPIDFQNVPIEAQGLVDSINALMGKLRNLLESHNRFIADAAHQLRTPMAGIQAQLELAHQEKNATKRNANLSQVNHSMERLSHVVNQLLKLAHNQPDITQHIRLMELDLLAIAKETCAEMVPAAYKKNIDLGLDAEVVAAYVQGDAQRLKILLQNLIDNAIRYTPESGKISVSIVRQQDKIILSVEDNGLGIPQEEREKVFERFHRVMNTLQEGSGLGLSIVKEIVDLHNAKINISSPASGIGVRFDVIFSEAV